MKIIKRDGTIVDYDPEKIRVAIGKANNEVRRKEKATKEEIEEIINYIEELDKKRILVEDVQDIIEQQLMSIGKYELAKKYITYRYTRASCAFTMSSGSKNLLVISVLVIPAK